MNVWMRSLSVALVLASFLRCSGQLIEDSGSNVIVPSVASTAAIHEYFNVEPIYPPGKAIYRVFSGLRLDNKDARFLRGSKAKLAFSSGQELGPESLRYEDYPAFPELLGLLVYEWHVQFPGNRLSGHASQDWFTNQLSVLIGFARPYQGGTQYGWIRMERETTKPTELIGPNGEVRQVVFLPTAYAVNPFPDRPIRAGEPPELPVLSTEVLRDPSGPTRVRVRWPAGYPGVRLERARELKALMDWLPVEGVVGEEAIFDVPEDGQLYLRLGVSP